MICNHCGTQNVEGATFCKTCGHELISRELAIVPYNYYRRKRRRKITAIVLVTLAILVVATIAFIAGRRVAGQASGSDNNAIVRISSKLYYTKPEAANVVTDAESGVTFVNNELIVYVDPSASQHDAEYLFTRYGGKIVGSSTHTSSYQVRFTNTYTYDDILDLSTRLQRESLIEAVSRNTAMELREDAATQDPVWSDDDKQATWGLRAIGATKAWDLVRPGPTTKVGILDGLFYDEHEDLVRSFEEAVPAFDPSAVTAGDDLDTQAAHGTHMAGIVAASSNDKGTVGVAHGCKLCGYSGIANAVQTNDNHHVTLSYDLELGLTHLVAEEDCKVVAIGLSSADQPAADNSTSAENAIRALVQAGHNDFVICKSAGNQGEHDGLADNDFLGGIEAKDVRSRIIMVASASYNKGDGLTLSAFSNKGARVDVVAPGDQILSTTFRVDAPASGGSGVQSTYDYLSGTSMATSVTAGVAALAVAANPNLTGEQIKSIVCNNTSKTTFSVANKRAVGLVNAEAVVKKAQQLASDDSESADSNAALGVLNQSMTSDGTCLYAATEDNQDSYAAPSPAIVRINAKNKTKVVWQGVPILTGNNTTISPIIEPSKNGLFVLVPGLDWGSTRGLRCFFVPLDDKETKELEFGADVEWTPYGKPFLVHGDQIVYASVARGGSTYWEIHTCDHNGSSDVALDSGYILGGVPATSPVVLLGIRSDQVYFALIHQDGENRWLEVFSLALDGTDEARSVLRTASARGNCSNVCMVGNKLYTTERNDLVCYELKTSGAEDGTNTLMGQSLASQYGMSPTRSVVATVDVTATIAIWNMTDSVAYVYSQDTYPAKTWKVNLDTSKTDDSDDDVSDSTPGVAEEVDIAYPAYGYASLELAGNKAYSVHSYITELGDESTKDVTLWP